MHWTQLWVTNEGSLQMVGARWLFEGWTPPKRRVSRWFLFKANRNNQKRRVPNKRRAIAVGVVLIYAYPTALKELRSRNDAAMWMVLGDLLGNSCKRSQILGFPDRVATHGGFLTFLQTAVAQKTGTKMSCPGKWKHGPKPA